MEGLRGDYCGYGNTLEMKVPREGDCTASGGSSCSLCVEKDCVVPVVSAAEKRWYCTARCTVVPVVSAAVLQAVVPVVSAAILHALFL